jgi:hypothetical protein
MTTIRKVLTAWIGLLCLVNLGFAAYLEDSQSTPVPEPRPEIAPPLRHPVPTHPLHSLIRSVDVGAPVRYGNLSIFPLVANRRGGRSIRTLDEALSRGWISIGEREDARVNEILVRNDSRHTVFLMAGEIITGGKQNRIIRQDVLLGAGSGSVVVPVYCGEQDRWDAPRPHFKSGKSMADPRLRALAAESRPQASIWSGIDSRMAEAEVRSSTRNYQEIYEDSKSRDELDRCVARFRRLRARDTVGLVAVSGHRIVGCDLFSDPELLTRLWDKICRSYAVGTLGRGRVPGHHRHMDVTPRSVRLFLNGIFASRFRHQHTPGSGEATRISGGVHGHALSWQGDVVHAALFPGITVLRDRMDLPEPRPEPRIERPPSGSIWGSE